MINQKIEIVNPTGFQLAIAEKICNTAKGFSSEIFIIKDSSVTNAKSILSILGSGIKRKNQIELQCSGEDEERALKAMMELLQGWNQ